MARSKVKDRVKTKDNAGYALVTITHADVVSSLCTELPLHLYFAPFGLGYVKLLHSFELSEDT